MSSIFEYIKESAERPAPCWLSGISGSSEFPLQSFFSSRIVYAPDSGYRGDAIQMFSEAKLAQCFLSSDAEYPIKRLIEQITIPTHTGHHRGYELVRFSEISTDELASWWGLSSPQNPPAMWAVFKRKAEVPHRHGVPFFCLVHIAAEVSDVYRRIFCKDGHHPPFALFDHSHRALEKIGEMVLGHESAIPHWIAYRPYNDMIIGPGKQLVNTPIHVMSKHPEELPAWLSAYSPGDQFVFRDFFGSRTIFYTCSGTDAAPVRVFGTTRAAHCFVYADCSISQEAARGVYSGGFIEGYKCINTTELDINAFIEPGWNPQFVAPEYFLARIEQNFVLWCVFEREKTDIESRGPERFSILHFGAELHAVFESLYLRNRIPMAYGIVLDNPFGRWPKFDAGCELWELCRQKRPYPKWLLAHEVLAPWQGYIASSRVEDERLLLTRRGRKRA